MHTRFKLLPASGEVDLDPGLLKQSLPHGFEVEVLSDGFYVEVPADSAEDRRAQYLIDRELDRIYFLTCVRVRAEMIRRKVSATFTASWSVHGALPHSVAPLSWTYDLALQLRLWSAASATTDPLVKILLLFQIIELAYPDTGHFPEYLDTSTPPHPRPECRFIRHLIAHAGDVKLTQLKTYCEHLGLPTLMLDRTDPAHVGVIAGKLPLVEDQARRVLASAVL
jgi:hypothetical protein